MPISLKHINTSDSDSIKLDKVNYNFDQLVANGGGPRGPQGFTGRSGTQGVTGYEGVQGNGTIGDQGYQGPQGSSSSSYWKHIPPTVNIDANTLVPVHNTPDRFAPVVSIGYIDKDSDYLIKSKLDGGKTPYQWVIHRKSYLRSNLQFLNELIPTYSYDFKLEKATGAIKKDKMSMGFFNLTDSISTYRSVEISFRDSILSTDSLLIKASGTSFKKPTTFNSPVVIKNRLMIENADAEINKVKVATSYDGNGWVKFKNVQDLKGTVPFGTIVSILPSIFADNNFFINSHAANLIDETIPLHILAGRGVGAYEGWYLCNGKEWTNGSVAYSVPMLGKFNYQIDDNENSSSPSGQSLVPLTSNNKTHITGGSDVDMIATAVPTLVYNITSTVEASSLMVGPGTGTTFKIKQLPQIIYLGNNDLYWFDAGTTLHLPVKLTFLLNDTNTTASKLNPNPYTLSVVTDRAVNNTYSITTTVTAPSGYYWAELPTQGDITGLPWYATIPVGGITLGSVTFPTTISIVIDISSHPDVETISTLNIDTTALTDLATEIITLSRSNPLHVTCTTPDYDNVPYNFITGYTFQLIYEANAGYFFITNQPQSVSYSQPPYTSPPVGYGTITVLNSTLTNSNKTLTMDVSLTGVPYPGYYMTQGYSINTSVVALSPMITYASGGFYQISSSQGNGVISETITIENYTGSTVYIWVAIKQNTGGIGGNVNAYYVKTVAPTFSLWATATLIAGTYYSTPYTLNTGNSITGTFYRASTGDSAHTVDLMWSSTLTGEKTYFTE